MRWKSLLATALLMAPTRAWAQIPEQAGESHDELPAPEGPPEISAERYVEDYSYLRDPQNRTGAWWERLKYLPLTSGGAVYLTLGDDLRLRPELLVHNRFERGDRPVDPYFRYRQLPYGDLHLGEDARVFLQLMATYAIRSHLTKSAFVDQSGLEILQGFAEGRVKIAGEHQLLLRLGRWSMAYGGERLVSTGPNVRTSFQGALVRWQHRDWRLDTFFVLPTRPRFGEFNDAADHTRSLWTVYLSHKVTALGPEARLQVFYFGFINEKAQFNEGNGFERRHTLGARFAGGPPGGWQWDVETHQQFGTFATGDIHAWSIGTAQRYSFEKWPLKPSLGLRMNAISGDARAGDGRLGTFNPLFTTAEYFGDIAEIGPANLYNLRASATFNLGHGVAVSGTVEPFWRQRTGDALYSPALRIIRPSDDSDQHFVGTQFETQIAWTVNRNLSTRLEYITIVPGDFIFDTGEALSIQFGLLELNFKY